MKISDDDDRLDRACQTRPVDPLFEFRVQMVELIADELGERLSMLEGVVFAMKRQANHLDGPKPGRIGPSPSDPFLPQLKRGTA